MSTTLPAIDRGTTAQLCRALADETRIKVIELLASGEQCVCDIQASLGISQSLLSFHLRVLRDAQIVSDRRSGRWAFYSLRHEGLQALDDLVELMRSRAERASSAACCS